MTQNCIKCGKPRAIKKHELPDWTCVSCNSLCEKVTNLNKNYAYKCLICKKEVEIAELIPH